ncbi:MAG: serine protease [Clostridia bacterium]|nr:serine protease [Clostridia bacterium]
MDMSSEGFPGGAGQDLFGETQEEKSKKNKKQKPEKTEKQQLTSFGVGLVVLCFALSLVAGAGGAFAFINVYPALTGKSFLPSEEITEGEMHEIPTSDTQGQAVTPPSDVSETEPSQEQEGHEESSSQAPEENSEDGSVKSKSDIYAQSVDSIVGIKVARDKSYKTFFGKSYTETVPATGSGFFITDDGYIVTNYHVIKDSGDVTVTTFDGGSYKAAVRGYEEANDIAVLKIEGCFKSVRLGSSSELSVGDDILVIGNPLGSLSYTFTDGVVSYLDRLIAGDTGTAINMFQTNAAINEGNSGGPVFNIKGEAVGIASAKYTSSNIEGLGFCIPIDDVKGMIDDIIRTGYVTGKPVLGVSLQTVSRSISAKSGIPTGCYVVAVGEKTTADNAGIVTADVITAVDGTAVSSVSELSAALSEKRAGDTVSVRVSRGGMDMLFNIVLDEYVPGEARTSYSNVFDF